MRRRPLMAVFLLLATFGSAQAIPRYSVRYGQDCRLCHQNPTGGGQRSAYATQYLIPAEMVTFPWEEERLEAIDPQIGKNVSIGADIRTLHVVTEEGSGLDGFFQMQGEVYLSLSVDERNMLYFEQGMDRTYDLFGISYFLPWQGYVKVGRFAPAYGWRFADHTRLVRSELGFEPPALSDVGAEVGISPGDATFSLSVSNGAGGSTLDNDARPALVARAEERFSLGPLAISAGASALQHNGIVRRRAQTGPFAGLYWGRLSWLGEIDWVWTQAQGADEVRGLVATQEVALQLWSGVDLVGVYDYSDRDLDLKSGKTTGYSVGVEMLPQPFMSLQALVRSWDDVGVETTQTLLQAHFMY